MLLSLCRLFEVESHLNPGDQLQHLTLCSSRICLNPMKYLSLLYTFFHKKKKKKKTEAKKTP